MKLDMDLVRSILLAVEELPPDAQESIAIPGVSPAVVAGHVEVLADGGLLKAKMLKSFGADAQFMISGMTLEGYQYLENIRTDSRWKDVKSTIVSRGGAMTLDIIKAVGIAVAKQHMGLP